MASTIDRNDLFEIETHGHAPTGKVHPEPWMRAPEIQAIFSALEADGAEVRFVGGCVRDTLAGRPVNDIDLSTTSPPDVTMALLEQVGIRALPTGIAHGTVTAVINEQTFEITTLREDVATNGRQATVSYTDNWFADARRRDFTFNAMTATQDGDVYDPYNGIADLAHGRVQFIGKARDRIAEDYLRILRFFRFQATHGRPPANKEALSACRQAADQLGTLSGERVRSEMMRILNATGVADTLLLMRGEGVLEQVLPEVGDIGRLRALVWLTTRAIKLDTVKLDPLRNLAAVLNTDQDGSAVDTIADRWRLSGKDRGRLKRMTVPLDLEPDAAANDVQKYLYVHGAEQLRDRALLQWATEVGMDARLPAERTNAWINVLERAEQWAPSESPTFPLNGEDVLALGVQPGPKVGEILDQAKEWWCDGGFEADMDACLVHLSKIVSNAD
jgi:poly(A) polymerase